MQVIGIAGGILSLVGAVNVKAIVLSIAILAAPFVLLRLENKKLSFSRLRKELLLSKIKLGRTLLEGAGLFVIVFFVLIILGLVLNALGLLDNQAVAQVISSQDALTLAIAITLSPVGEELLFRGYLQKRIGLMPQALLFGILHYGYGSIAEILAAVSVGLVFGLYIRRNKNIYTTMVAHALYNLFSIIIVLAFVKGA